MSGVAHINIPERLLSVFAAPRGTVQYRCAYGGRGSGKSFNFALMAALWGFQSPLRILCVREFQVSIAESFYAELCSAIDTYAWLRRHYTVTRDAITGLNGTRFIFRGLSRNVQSIKSLAQIDLTIVEEAETVTEASWLALEATVLRRDMSEIWVIWNPERDGSPTDKRFRKTPPWNAAITSINYNHNPFFPSRLNDLRVRQMDTLDAATYDWVWCGEYRRNSDAQVFAGRYTVDEFTPGDNWDGPYHGLDWGFASDPTAAVRCWIADRMLWIEYEAGARNLSLDDTALYLSERIPGIEQYTIRADNARPESINHVRARGLPLITAVDKWPGSVEDGVSHMRSYDQIIIHPRCVETRREFDLYSHKVDRLTGDVLPPIVDAHNHYVDCIRYALSPVVRRRGYIFEV